MERKQLTCNSFIFYGSFYESISNLPLENQARIYDAIFKFAFENIEVELSGVDLAIFLLIKPQLVANRTKYENGCKGGRPSKNDNQAETQSEPNGGQIETEVKPNENLNETEIKPNDNLTETEAKPNENENVNVNENENVNEKDINMHAGMPARMPDRMPARMREVKHKYGKYKNVLLTEHEHDKLMLEHNDGEQAIEYLSEYREMKGYKAKSDYLAILKWVFTALEEEKQRNNRLKSKDVDKSSTGNPFLDLIAQEGDEI